ncbi:putative leucine--tRNA ligase, cytoplasmic [Astathelohania contejeani]|uniref:leucine--tRNA ligase n=1 Tax=Astathelohania contejeani TaxID=164912 RepID=A0ABQ7I1M3_9MICR|nr:putative leucine--tRNA ligase, cytoplasmic [Thelohania contejeani]
MNTSNSKLEYLTTIEKSNPMHSDFIPGKDKYFITFPYPYMNGKLHLGHLFSLSKAEFQARYRMLQGYNILFPLAFHCTGMPIAASAQRLKEELKTEKKGGTVYDILESMGLTDIEHFTDPQHWLKTFPILAKNTLINFQCAVDWRRSFITTDINPYYDSFVRWQFNRLKKLGLISFGKRYTIFCPKDKQACLDHDRMKGENIMPIERELLLTELTEGYLCVLKDISDNTNSNDNTGGVIIVDPDVKFVCFRHKDKLYTCTEEVYANLKEQIETEEIKRHDVYSLPDKIKLKGEEYEIKYFKYNKGCGIRKFKNKTKTYQPEDKFDYIMRYYEPESEVISRSGARCVVALMDQWFLDYGNEEWKLKARKCLERMEATPETKDMLADGLDWINKWGCSRSFGLGTRLPWDPQYVIDSLSDSTIYMAFYTVKHFLFSDLEGREEIFPSEKLSDEVWDYIFCNSDSKIDDPILSKCRESFSYWYPVDLRVSGKDLIKNHLLFFIFNHVALFEEEFWPKRIFTNGHLLLNSEKMSKSTGNFLTADQCLERYGASATRMCLALCGDANEDANFVESNANALILRLYSLVKDIEKYHNNKINNSNKNINDSIEKMNINDDTQSFLIHYLKEGLVTNLGLTKSAYESMQYSNVVKYGFYEMINLRDSYLSLGGDGSCDVIGELYKCIVIALYPITNGLSEGLISLYYKCDLSWPEVGVISQGNYLLSVEYLRRVIKTIKQKLRKKKKVSKIHILIGKEFCQWKQECLKTDRTLESIRPVLLHHGISETKGMLFVKEYEKHSEEYGIIDECGVLNMFKGYMEKQIGIEINIEFEERGEPMSPFFVFE